MAALLVDLHRNGIYWGDCSLANTLFTRDGQIIQAWLVDAETAEFHPSLSDGQRDIDLEIMRENVAGGLLDVAARRDEPPEVSAQVFDEVRSIVERYEQLWLLLHDEPVLGLDRPAPRSTHGCGASTTSASRSTRCASKDSPRRRPVRRRPRTNRSA